MTNGHPAGRAPIVRADKILTIFTSLSADVALTMPAPWD